MGGKGSGGSRYRGRRPKGDRVVIVGCRRKPGRKPIEGPRDSGGRLRKTAPKDACACGAPKAVGTVQCRSCHLLAVARKPRKCIMCGADFVRHYSSKTCGVECGKARVRQVNAAKRTSPDSVRIRRRRSNALRRQRAGGHHQSGRWRRICERDGYECHICNQPIDAELRAPDRMSPSVDHVVPLAHGGADTDDNLKPAHYGCNSRRGAIAKEAA